MVSNACEMPRLADGHGFAVKNASTSAAASAVLSPLIGTVAMRVTCMPVNNSVDAVNDTSYVAVTSAHLC